MNIVCSDPQQSICFALPLLLHVWVLWCWLLSCLLPQATSTPSSTDQMTPQMPDTPDAFRPPQGASASTVAATTNPPEESQALPAQQRQQQGNAATSREGVIREAPAAADTAKPTTSSPAAVKSSAGGGLRGGAWVWQLLLAGCIAVLLL